MSGQFETSIAELIGRIDLALSEDDVQVNELRQEVNERTDEAAVLKQEVLVLREEIASLKSVNAGLHEAQQEAEMTLSQLHQSQQELQRYFLRCQKQSELLKASEELQERSIVLLATANS